MRERNKMDALLIAIFCFNFECQFSSMVAETGEDNAEVLRSRANGHPIDEALLARLREQRNKESTKLPNGEQNAKKVTSVLNDAAKTPRNAKSNWNLLKRQKSSLGGPGLIASQSSNNNAVSCVHFD